MGRAEAEMFAAIVARKEAEIERLLADMRQIEAIANIPPADDRYGSLAVRMNKVWMLARGNEQGARPSSFVDKHGFEICSKCHVEIKGGRCGCDDPILK